MKTYTIFAALLCLSACGGQSGPDNINIDPPIAKPPAELGTGTWVLKYVANAKGIRTHPPHSASYHLNFEADGTLAGIIDCNHFSSSYSAGGGELTIAPLQMDAALCPEAHEQATRTVASSLAEAAHFTLRNNELIVLSNSGSQLTFEQMHTGCEQPIAIAEGPTSGPATVVATPEANAGEIVAELEASRPDFVLRDHGNCTNTFTATMNSNTLSMLRCRGDIKTISF